MCTVVSGVTKGNGDGGGGSCPRVQRQASSAKQRRQKYFTTNDHKIVLMQCSFASCHFADCRKKAKLRQPLSTSLAYCWRQIIFMALNDWRMGTTMLVYFTKNRTVGVTPTWRLSGEEREWVGCTILHYFCPPGAVNLVTPLYFVAVVRPTCMYCTYPQHTIPQSNDASVV